MKLLELMSKLRKIHTNHGNLEVEFRTLNLLAGAPIASLVVVLSDTGPCLYLGGELKYVHQKAERPE